MSFISIVSISTNLSDGDSSFWRKKQEDTCGLTPDSHHLSHLAIETLLRYKAIKKVSLSRLRVNHLKNKVKHLCLSHFVNSYSSSFVRHFQEIKNLRIFSLFSLQQNFCVSRLWIVNHNSFILNSSYFWHKKTSLKVFEI